MTAVFAPGEALRVAVLTNAPAPYRSPMYAALAQSGAIAPSLIYCAPPHIDAAQREDGQGYAAHFLQGRYWAFERRFIHADPAVWRLLSDIRPSAVVTTGFIPTYLMGYAWARRHRVPHIAMSDGTLRHEAGLSAAHRWMRRHVYGRSAAWVGASRESLRLFTHYGADPARCFLAGLCIDNDRFDVVAPKRLDLLISGRLIASKRPGFALEVAQRVAQRLGRPVTLGVLGDGPLREELARQAEAMRDQVEVVWLGYRPQSELPALYASARVLLFPTAWEAWGLVVNEACAAAVPVLTTDATAAAGELVVDGDNGFVLPPELDTWAEHAARLLADPDLAERMGRRGRERVRAGWAFTHAAHGMAQAVHAAVAHAGRVPRQA